MNSLIFDTLIETKRLLLRKINLSDAYDMYEYTSNPLVTTYLQWEPHTQIADTQGYIAGVIKKYESLDTEFTFGIELKSEKKLIGVLKVLNISYYNKRGEFTSILNPLYQKNGYMGEAWIGLLDFCFNNAGLNRIQSYVTEDNIASINKNLKAGLVFEGRLKEYLYVKGEFKDTLVYAITAEKFNNRAQ